MEKKVDYDKVAIQLSRLTKFQPTMKCQYFRDYPAPWFEYQNGKELQRYIKKYGYPNHREILKYEIVIDIDSDNSVEGKKHADLVQERFDKKKLFYERHISGGDGEHFHLFFHRRAFNKLLNKYYLSEVRRYIIKDIIGKDLLHPEGIKSHVCLFDKKLIQIEDMLHRKGGIKTLVHRTKYGINDIPQGVLGKLERQRKINDDRKARIKERIKMGILPNMNCVKYILGEEINGMLYVKEQQGFYRSMFLLVAHFMRKGIDQKEIIKKILDWYDSMPETMKNKTRRTVNKEKIIYTIKHTNGTAGCNYAMKMLEDCKALKVCDGCPYF